VQTLCVFVLRSYRITVAPLVVYCVLLWGLGLGGGYLVAYHTGLEPMAGITRPVLGVPAPWRWLVTAAAFVAMLWVAAARSTQGDRVAVCGEGDRKGGALAQLAGDIERCAMALQHMLDDGQPQAVPPVSRERLRSTR
jgi:hypothetical protein